MHACAKVAFLDALFTHISARLLRAFLSCVPNVSPLLAWSHGWVLLPHISAHNNVFFSSSRPCRICVLNISISYFAFFRSCDNAHTCETGRDASLTTFLCKDGIQGGFSQIIKGQTVELPTPKTRFHLPRDDFFSSLRYFNRIRSNHLPITWETGDLCL